MEFIFWSHADFIQLLGSMGLALPHRLMACRLDDPRRAWFQVVDDITAPRPMFTPILSTPEQRKMEGKRA